MVTVGMKRKLDLKNYHKLGMIRPKAIHAALVYLQKNHPEYKNIDIGKMDDWINPEDDEYGSHSSGSSEESESEDEDPSGDIFSSTTCLLPEEPLNDVIGNFFSIRMYLRIFHITIYLQLTQPKII